MAPADATRLAAADWLEEKLRGIDRRLEDCGPLRKASDQLQLHPRIVAAAGLFWLLGFLFWGFTGEIVCTVVALLYPTYASFRALEDQEEGSSDVWLSYWVTYAVMTLTEKALSNFLFWVPFYHMFRLSLIVWLFHPLTLGARTVYTWVLGPLFRAYRPKVDAALATMELESSLCGELSEDICETLKHVAKNGAGYVQDLGINDLMAQELSKAAAAHLSLVSAPTNAAEKAGPTKVGARARVASPRPAACLPSPSAEKQLLQHQDSPEPAEVLSS